MDPTQNPTTGGQPTSTPANAGIDELKTLITDLGASVQTKMDEMDNTVSSIKDENAELRKYITDGAAQPPAATAPAAGEPGWVPKSWDDFPQLVRDEAAKIVQGEFDRARSESAQMSKEQQEAQARIDREIDNQLDQLTKDGLLPAVTNSRDPNDPGNLARKELLALGVKLETPNLDAVARDVLAPAHASGQTFDASTGTWTRSDPLLPGRLSPVGSSSQRTTSSPSGPDYATIHKARSMDDLVAFADRNGYGPVPNQV